MPPKIGAHVRLGGKRRTLRYTWPALNRAQEELDGQSIRETMEQVFYMSPRHVTVMVWAGLLHEMPEVTISEVEEMIEPPAKRLVDAMSDALEPWINVDEEDEGEGNGKRGAKG